MVWLPGEPPPRVSVADLPVGLWRTWLLLTALYLVLNWLPYPKNPAPIFRLFTPITPASFGTARILLALPFALLSMYAGEALGKTLRPKIVRILYNWTLLFTLTAGVDLLLWGQWKSLETLLR